MHRILCWLQIALGIFRCLFLAHFSILDHYLYANYPNVEIYLSGFITHFWCVYIYARN